MIINQIVIKISFDRLSYCEYNSRISNLGYSQYDYQVTVLVIS